MRWSVVSALKSQRDLKLENVAFRHQLMVLQRQPGGLRLKDRDRLFWVRLRRAWPGWQRAVVLAPPATVVKWHRNGFRAYWRWKSRPKGGRPRKVVSDGIVCGLIAARASSAEPECIIGGNV